MTATSEKIWHGYQSNLWSNGNNWSTSATIPQPSETAIFDSTVSNNNCLLDVDTSINGLSANTYTGSLNLSSYTLSVKTDAYLEHLTNLETSASTLKFTDTGVATLSSNTFYNLEFAGNTGLSGSNTSAVATEVSNNLTVGGTLNIGNDNNGSGVHDLKLLSGSTMNSSNGIITGDGRLYIVDDVLLDTTGTLSNYAINYVSSAANVTVMSGDYSNVSIVQLINDDSTPHIFEFQGGIHKYTYLDAGLGNNTDVAGTIISLSANSPSVSASTIDVRNYAVTNHVQFFIGDTDFLCNSLLSTSGTKTISASGGRIILGGEDTINNFQGMDNVIETDLVFEDGPYTIYGTTSPAPINEAVIKANNITVSGSSTNTPILNFLHVDTLSAVNDIIISGGPSTFTNLQGSKLAAGNNIKFIGQGNTPTTRLNMDPTSTWYQEAGNKIWAWYADIQNAVVSGGTTEISGNVTVTATVSTFAGSGSSGDTNGTGSSASFNTPSGVAVDSSGNIYVADLLNHKIRKITPAGVVSTIAGTGSVGSNDGAGASASFNGPRGLAVDASGNVYVADTYNNKIRKITSAGVVSTFAGTGSQGDTDGAGASASFNQPYGVAVDGVGNVYVADTYNHKIRKITPSGVVSTLAGTGSAGSNDGAGSSATFSYPYDVAVDSSGNIYVADRNNYKIRKITPSGVVSTVAGTGSQGSINDPATFNAPEAVAIDASGNIYVADTINAKIRKITPAGVVSTFVGDLSLGDKDGAAENARFHTPSGVAVDASGNVYVADAGNDKIRKIVLTQTISYHDVSTFAGTGGNGDTNGAGTTASFNDPRGVTLDSSGNVYVADTDNHRIRKITPLGVVSTFAGTGAFGSVDGAGASATFWDPYDVTVDSSDNIYVADMNSRKIRKITPSGVVSTLAGNGSYGAGDGAGASASFNQPKGLAVDSSDNIYVADYNNDKIRKITPAGVVSTLAGTGSQGSNDGAGSSATFYAPLDVAVDSSNNIYVADAGNNKIRKITPLGVVSTFAGSGVAGSTNGTGTLATFDSPQGVVLDSSDNIYVASLVNDLIRKITPAGVVSTFAGTGESAPYIGAPGTGGTDGPGNVATFYRPQGLAVDSSDNIYVADKSNHKIRKIQSAGEGSTIFTSGNAAATDNLGGNTNWFFENDRNNLTDGAIVTVDQTTKRSGSPITLSFTATDTQTGITSSDISIDLDPLIGAIVPGSFNYEVANELTFNVEISAVTSSATNIEVTTINGSQLTATDTFGPYDYDTTAGTISFQNSVPSYGIKNDEISVLIFADDILGFPLGGPATVFYGEYNGQVVSFNNFYIEDTTRAVVEAILPATTETLSGNLSISATNIEGTTFTGNSSAVGKYYTVDLTPPEVTFTYSPTNQIAYNFISVSANVSDNVGFSTSFDSTITDYYFIDSNGVTYPSPATSVLSTDKTLLTQTFDSYGDVSTIAGTGTNGSNNGAGASATFHLPANIAVDSSGNVYVADTYNHKIRKIDTNNVVSTFAGTGSQGDTDGASATFYGPQDVALDSSGNVYVADTYNNKIRKITSTGVVSTLAGTGSQGSNDGVGASATFYYPYGVAVDSSGNVYVADGVNRKVRKITPSGVVSTLAVTGSSGFPQDVALDSSGNVYVADYDGNKILKITPSGVVSTLAGTGSQGEDNGVGASATFYRPRGVAVDSSGNVYVADTYNHEIRKITPSGVVSTFVGSGAIGSNNGTGSSATFYRPGGVAVDTSGNVYVADTNNHKIRKILVTPEKEMNAFEFEISASGTLYLTLKDTAGNITTCADDGYITEPTIIIGTPSPSKATPIDTNIVVPISAFGTLTDNKDNYYAKLLSTNNDEVELFWSDVTSPAINVNTFNVILSGNDKLVGSVVVSGGVLKLAMVSTLAGTGSPGSNDGVGTLATFLVPNGIVVDSSGNVYVADEANNKIRKINTNGIVSTFASVTSPQGLITDSSDNLYVTDFINNKILKITPSGVVSTVAGTGSPGSVNGPGASASFAGPNDIAMDSLGNIYVADTFNCNIRKIDTNNVVSTFAGTGSAGSIDGTGTAASFSFPAGVDIDSSDNIYVGDTSNHKIRKITPAGVVSTFAGTGTPIPGGVDGPGATASFAIPHGVDVDSSDNIYVADTGNSKIRKITPSGVVSTFAGSFSTGDADGPVNAARFNFPRKVVVDASGNVYVSDTNNNKIRKIVIDP